MKKILNFEKHTGNFEKKFGNIGKVRMEFWKKIPGKFEWNLPKTIFPEFHVFFFFKFPLLVSP